MEGLISYDLERRLVGCREISNCAAPIGHSRTTGSLRAAACNSTGAKDRHHWNSLFEARVIMGDFKEDHNRRHRHSALGYSTPAEHATACSCTHTPVVCEIKSTLKMLIPAIRKDNFL
jgi:hypothetical protein